MIPTGSISWELLTVITSLIHDAIFHLNSHLAQQIAAIRNLRRKRVSKEFCSPCQNRPTSSCLIRHNVRRETFFSFHSYWWMILSLYFAQTQTTFQLFFTSLRWRPKSYNENRKTYQSRSKSATRKWLRLNFVVTLKSILIDTTKHTSLHCV